MGRPIVYCGLCGKSLKEDDFSKGRAHVVDNASYCVTCRIVPEPLQAPPRPAPLPTSTPKPMPPPKPLPTSTPRQHSAAPPPPPASSSSTVVGVCVAIALAIVALAVLLLNSGSPPAPPPAPTPPPPLPRRVPEAPSVPDEAARSAIQTLEAFASGSADPDAVLERCQAARSTLRGTPYQSRLEAVEARALEARAARDRDRQISALVDSVRRTRALDPQFARRQEIVTMLQGALPTAGARRAELEKLLAEYQAAADAFAAKPPDPPPPKLLFSENFNKGRGSFVGGEVVPGGVDGTTAMAVPHKSTQLGIALPDVAEPTWMLRVKMKPLVPMKAVEIVIWSNRSRANFRYHVRGLKANEWNLLEVKASQLNQKWEGGGKTFEGETVNDLRFYFDDAAPDGSLLIDDVEILQ
jgi:hypothetical protein